MKYEQLLNTLSVLTFQENSMIVFFNGISIILYPAACFYRRDCRVGRTFLFFPGLIYLELKCRKY